MKTAKLLTLGLFGGSASFSPLSISGLTLWLDASDASTLFQDDAATTPATADTNPIGYWGDKSGTGRHVTQSVAGSKPVLKLAARNGRNGVLFSSDYLWRAALGVTLSTSSIFVVFSHIGTPITARLVQGTTLDDGHLIYAVTGKYSMYAGTQVAGADQSNAAHIMAARFTGTAASNQRTDAGTTYTGNAGSATMSTLAIGARDVAGTPAVFFNGYIYELIIVNGVVSDAVRNATESYLNAKWAVY